MNIWKSIKKVFSTKHSAMSRFVDEPGYDGSRFGTIIPHRINKEHWELATGQSINNDLLTKLASLQARCAYEYGSNPDFEGVCNTYKDDCIGRNGPALQIISDSPRFNDAVEAAWKEVFADPDPSHRYGGVEDLKTWVQGLLLAGSYVNIATNVKRQDSRMTFGWRSIHARRLVTPAQFAGNPYIAFGCKYDKKTGAPIEYYIAKPQQLGGFSIQTNQFDTVKANAVQHCFMPVEAEQLTGYPMMSSTLDTAADLRDLDKFVLESIKNSAANNPSLQAMHPEAVVDPDPVPTDTVRYEPGETAVAPLGWAWASTESTHPTSEYIPFKHEKAAELGRPIHMPLLVVLLTAQGANFSSAQYEGTVYADGIAGTQGFIERRSLVPFVMHGIIPEIAFRMRLRIPKKIELVWTWNVPAHANIEKFVKAIRMMIEDGVIAPSNASAMVGHDWEKVIAARKKCAEDLEAAGLPPSPVNTGGAVAAEPPEEDDDDDNKPNNENRSRISVNRFSLT